MPIPYRNKLRIPYKAYALIEKLNKWFCSGQNGIWTGIGGDTNTDFGSQSNTLFATDRVAFTFACIGTQAPVATENGVDYGIVPFPKIDENQKEYYGGCTDLLFSVPITVADTEQVGLILETMAYAGYKHIRPAYRDKILQSRFATDVDCSEMLNLIFYNQLISLAYAFSTEVQTGGSQLVFIANTVQKNSVANFLRTKSRQEDRALKAIAEFYS